MTGTKISLDQACRTLQSGGVVALPTETVYGLAADILNPSAIRQIFQIKKRPLFDPLIVHCSHKSKLRYLCKYTSPIVEKLSEYFHPGPLTLVLPKKSHVSDVITAGSTKVAVRIPDHPLTLSLLEKTDMCVAAPSANLFTKTSPTRAYHVMDTLNVPVLDGGPCSVGIESTILEVNEAQKTLYILRPGIIGINLINHFCQKNHFTDWTIKYKSSTSVPGSISSHYQPDVPLLIFNSKKSDNFSDNVIDIEAQIKELYPGRSPKELKLQEEPWLCARELYHKLRQLSKDPNCVGYIIKNPLFYKNSEEWTAIWDRLEKAAFKTI